MHRVRRRERCFCSSTTANAAADSGAWRPDKTTRAGSDSRNHVAHHADTKSDRASGNAANESDRTTRNDPGTNTVSNASGR